MCNFTALDSLAMEERNYTGDVQFYCFGYARDGGEKLHRRCAILLLWIRSRWRGEIAQAMCNFIALDSLALEERNCAGDAQFSRFRVPSRWGCRPQGDLCVLSFFGFIMHVGIDRKGVPLPFIGNLTRFSLYSIPSACAFAAAVQQATKVVDANHTGTSKT